MSHPPASPTPWPSILFVLGLAVFGLVRLSLVVIPPIALNVPRLGDDALVYLWKGALNREWYGTDAPAVRDVLVQGDLKDHPSAQVRQIRSRMLGRVVGTYGPIYDLLPSGALFLGFPAKWAFALTEVLGVAVMTVGIAGFLAELVGTGAAGVGLVLLAWAILPAQGISSFIPSTLALSLSLGLWALLLSWGETVSVLPIWLVAGLILGVHPIGQLYVLMAIPIHGVAVGGVRRMLRSKHLLLYGGLVALALVAAALPGLVPRLALLDAGPRGGIEGGAGFLSNLARAWSLFLDPFVRKNLLLVGILACAVSVQRQALLTSRISGVLGILGTAMLAALFHTLPGYPGELFFRLFVPAVIVAAGLAGRFVVHWAGARIPVRALVSLGLVGLGVTAVLWVNEWFHALNLRTEVVLEDRVRASLAGLPDGATVLYAETDTALMVSLLSGGERFGALAFPALAGTPSLERFVRLRKPEVIVAPAFRGLNTLAVQRAKTLTPRRHGFFFPAVDRLTIRPSPGQALADLHLYVRTGPYPVRLGLSMEGSEVGRTPRGVERDVPARFDGWVRVWDSRMEGAMGVSVSLPDAWGWVEGIATEVPRPHVRWPWTAEVSVRYHGRGRPPERETSILFSVDDLLSEYGALALVPLVHPKASIISDDSGLVFLRTTFAGGGV